MMNKDGEKDKKQVKNEENDSDIVAVDLLDVLLDEKNTAPIYFSDDKGNRFEFEQIAVLPYGEEDLYCILKPITEIPGIKKEDAIVFQVVEDENGDAILRVEDREEIASDVFIQYYDLMEEDCKNRIKALERARHYIGSGNRSEKEFLTCEEEKYLAKIKAAAEGSEQPHAESDSENCGEAEEAYKERLANAEDVEMLIEYYKYKTEEIEKRKRDLR